MDQSNPDQVTPQHGLKRELRPPDLALMQVLPVLGRGWAVDGLARNSRPWRLLVAGASPELPKSEALAEAHPAWEGRARFLGVSSAELRNAMDVYVSFSPIEGIANWFLEAMATGLPVAATASGEAGLLFSAGDDAGPTDHSLAVAAPSEWRLDLGQRARRRLGEEFSIDSMVWKYEEAYESLGSTAAAAMRAVARV